MSDVTLCYVSWCHVVDVTLCNILRCQMSHVTLCNVLQYHVSDVTSCPVSRRHLSEVSQKIRKIRACMVWGCENHAYCRNHNKLNHNIIRLGSRGVVAAWSDILLTFLFCKQVCFVYVACRLLENITYSYLALYLVDNLQYPKVRKRMLYFVSDPG